MSAGDRIVQFDKVPICDLPDLNECLDHCKAGDSIRS